MVSPLSLFVFSLPFSCLLAAPKRRKDAQSATQYETENQPVFVGEMRDLATLGNELQIAANDAFSAC
jgi:hypothetical protein